MAHTRNTARKRRDPYGILWTIVLIIFFALIIILVVKRKAPEDIEDITLQAKLTSEDEQHFDMTHPPDFTVEAAEIVLSEEDGSLKLRLLTDKIIGENEVIGVKKLSARFKLEDSSILLIEAGECSYIISDGRATVEGELRGEIGERGQSFTARKLYWDEDSTTITAEEVDLVDPQFVSRGGRMTIDLTSGMIEMSGGVSLDL